MKRKGLMFQRIILYATVWLGLIAAGWAQPPTLMHYQGRLTNTSGTPLTTAQTLYFSLWQGGTAGTANSGTQLYRERKTITPDANGVFEHQIGSGTVELGTLDPGDFDTANPIFIQVGVGSTGNVLLPRAQMTSVGYAFYATQAAHASVATQSGTPLVTKVSDATGGILVVGDLLKIEGSGLIDALVSIGGRTSRVKSRSDSQIICQIPEGTPMGLNPVTVAESASSFSSVTVATVNVHRLLVWVTAGINPSISIFDAMTLTKIADITTPSSIIGTDSQIPSLQMDFANEGSLALIPSNNNTGQFFAIDLTANPISSGVQTFYTGANKITAIAVSPDDRVAVLSDYRNSRMRTILINQNFPPYTSTVFNSVTGDLPPADKVYSSPRASTFVGDGMFIFCSSGTNELLAYRRVPGTDTFSFYRLNDTRHINVINRVILGALPFALRLTPDRTRLLVTTLSADNLVYLYIGPEGFGVNLIGSANAGSGAMQVAVAPRDGTVFVADVAQDLLHTMHISGDQITLVGDSEGPASTSVNDVLAAIEPVEGNLVAIGMDNSTVQFFQRTGASLPFLVSLPTPGTNSHPYEMEFQP